MKQLLKTIILAGLVLVAADRVFAMEFDVGTYTDSSNKYITAYGPIEEGDTQKFKDFVAANDLPEGTYITLHSGGGDVATAQSIAYQIRYISKFNTMVLNKNTCASACTDILLSGVESIGYKGAKIGFHSSAIADYGDFTGVELLQLGQEFAVADLYFALLYVKDDVPGWKVAGFYNDVMSRPDNSIMMYPSMTELLEAGMITKIK